MTTKKKKVAPKGAPKSKRKKLVAENPPLKTQPVFETKFTTTELVHLRDLLGVFLPPDGSLTVSQALAKQEGRVVAEKLLFDKIVELCVKAKIPVGEEAPDHIVGFAENPTLSVFQMTASVEEDEKSDLTEEEFTAIFGDGGGLLVAEDDD